MSQTSVGCLKERRRLFSPASALPPHPVTLYHRSDISLRVEILHVAPPACGSVPVRSGKHVPTQAVAEVASPLETRSPGRGAKGGGASLRRFRSNRLFCCCHGDFITTAASEGRATLQRRRQEGPQGTSLPGFNRCCGTHQRPCCPSAQI